MFLASARWLLDQVTAHVDDVMERAYADACRTRDEADVRAHQAQIDLAVERAVRIQQEARLASNATTIDFLTKELNTLNLERAVLLTRLTGIQMPNVEVVREATPATPPIETLGALLDRAVKNVPQTDAKSDLQTSEARAIGSIFDDIGDEAAHREGLGIDARGVLVTEH